MCIRDSSGIPPAPRGVPQIEVTFDVDANAILNVSAADKTTGRSEKITITNDKGRLSKEEIERMVADAEKYKAEDDAAAERIKARNGLESYTYNLRNSLNEEAFASKLDASDKDNLKKDIDETIEWIDNTQEGSIDEYNDKQKELEGIANPIMQKAYGAAGGAPGGAPGAGPAPGGDEGPQVEEID